MCPATLTKPQWLNRAARRYVERAGVHPHSADYLATVLFDTACRVEPFSGSPEAPASAWPQPEDEVDEELTNWDNDEAPA